jgi:gluconokinase
MILALDIGTSSTRAVLYDTESCRHVPGGTHAIHHEPDVTPDGGATLDADTLVREAVECMRTVLARVKDRPVRGVAVCTFWHSVLGVAADGRPTTPVLIWADTRSAPQVAALRAELDPTAYSQTTGCPLHTSYALGKLRWLAETDPVAFAASARFVSPGEYLIREFFGVSHVACSTSMASGSGLFDQAQGAWDDGVLGRVPGLAAERLSPISDAPVSGLLPAYRDTLPELADVPWFPALGDGVCSNVGCGAALPGTVALMIGTSGALRAVAPGTTPPILPPGLWRYQLDPGRFVLGGALSNGGSVWAWGQKTLQLPDVAEDRLEEQIAALPPDGHGLTVLPFFAGERAPLWRDDLRATIHGLTAATTSVEIVRAHLEAVALRFAAVREALRPVAPRARVIGTGGALLASPAWAQIIADALGEPLELSAEEQASSRGAALWARERLGRGTIEEAPPIPVTRTVEPNGASAEIYRAARERQEALLARLLPAAD